MADLEKTVSIIFSGVDKTGAVFAGITKNIDQFAGKVGDVTQPLADVAAGVLKTEGALAALAAGGLAYAYAKSIEFEGAVIDLQKVLGDEAGGLDAAKDAALALSNQYGVSATEVLQSTANFKQAGFDIEESIQLTKNALDLKIAGDVEAAQSSEILIAALKGFDAPASEAARLIDILNGVSNEYATDVGELATGIAKLSPIAKTMGFTFEQTAGLVTPIIEIFRSGDEAATALKTGLLKLVDDSKPIEEALKSIGVAQKDANGNLRSGKDIILDVSVAFQSLDQTQKLAVASQLVGINQAARMVTVFDNLNKTTAITQTALQSTGSASEEVALRLASGEVAVDRFKVGFENMAIAVGTKFQAAATNAISGATDIENTFQELVSSGVFDDLLNEVSGMSDEMAELFTGIAEAMPEAMENVDWSGFTASLQGVVDAVGNLFGAMFGDVDLTTPEGLAEAFQKIVDAGTALNNVVTGLLGAWEPFFRSLSDGIDKFSKGGPKVQEFVGKLLGFGQAINTVAGLVGPLAGSLTSLTNIFIGLAGIKAGKALLGFAGNATTTAAAVKGLPVALNAVIGSTAGKAGMMGLAAAVGWAAGTIINTHVPAVGQAAQSLLGWSDKLLNWTGTQKGANQTLKDNQAFLAAQAQALERVTYTLSELEEEIDGSGLVIKPVLDMEDLERELMNQDWSDFNIAPLSIPVETDFDSIQSDWDAITDELEESDIKLPVDADNRSIAATKKKIKKAFSKASMGPINLPIEFGGEGGSGMGGIADKFKDAFKQTEPIPIDDLVDMSGIAELLDAIKGMDDPIDKNRMKDAAMKIMESQRKIIDAERGNLNARTALAEQEWRTAQMTKMSGEQENVIKIEAAGLEAHMEAFMWQLLKMIQVRANKSGAEFLLAAT